MLIWSSSLVTIDDRLRVTAENRVEYFRCALADQFRADRLSEQARLGGGTPRRRPNRAVAVERHDDADQFELVATDRRRQGANRRLTAAAERFDQGPFGR